MKKLTHPGIPSLKPKGRKLQNKIIKQAFTLVELIVVITILAILGTIAFISLQGYSQDSRDAVRISDISRIKTSLELFQLGSGKYPLPTDITEITYSGAIAWSQGLFGEDTFKNVTNLDKIPLDPSTDKQYVYSVTNTRQEYQVAGIIEGEVVYNPAHLTPLLWSRGEKVQAAQKTAVLRISGTYNGKLLKVSTGGTDYVLAIPSIITSTGFTVEEIATNNYFAYNGYKNLPAQYAGGSYSLLGEEGLNLVDGANILVYSGSVTTLSSTKQDGIDARKLMLENLQTAYATSQISYIGEIAEILSLDTDNTDETEKLSSTIINNNLGGNAGLKSTSITYSNCELSGEIVTHNTSITAYETNLVTYGNTCNSEQRLCNNGTLDGTFTFTGCTVQGATGTFNLSQTTVTQGTNVTITDNCSQTPTSYTSSNETVATISGNIITTLSAGTTDITPVGGACGDSASKTLTVGAPQTFLGNCTANGQIYYADSTGYKLATVTNAGVATWESGKSISNLTCAGNIIMCSGNNTGYIIQACNAGATTLYASQNFVSATSVRDSSVNSWAGGLYQWGNKADVSYTSTSTTRPTCTTNSTFYQAIFIKIFDWCSSQTDNVWGGTTGTNTDRKGPCATGYHVPTNTEWIGVVSVGGWGTNLGTNLNNTLKLPFAGFRHRTDNTMYNQGVAGYYWSSLPNSTSSYQITISPTYVAPNNSSDRGFGYSVRCFKN